VSTIALLALAVLWAIVLVPDLVRRTAAARRADSIGQFARNRSVLRNSYPAVGRRQNPPFASGPQTVVDLRGPRPVVHQEATRAVRPAAPVVRTRAQQRRQDILTSLVAAALLSFLGFVTFGGVLLVLHVVIDVLLVAYLGLWLNVTKRERMRAQVSYLPGRPLAPLAPVARDRQRIAR